MLALTSNYSVSIPLETRGTTNAIVNYKYPHSEEQNASVTLNSSESPRLNDRIFRLLVEYKSLPENWDDEGAAAPHPSALLNAFYLYFVLEKSGQKIFHTAPGPNGEIMFDLRNDFTKKSVEVIFYPGNRSVYVTFCNTSEPKQGNFTFYLLFDLLEWLNSPE